MYFDRNAIFSCLKKRKEIDLKVADDHLYHGAAMIQIAEHEHFTAINSLKVKGKVIRVAYRINDDIVAYLKYATKPTKAFKEYPFTFNKDSLDELTEISTTHSKIFIALVCVRDREICCITYAQLQELIGRRSKEKGGPEGQYVVLVTVPSGKSLRVYVNTPGKRKTILGKMVTIPRNAFPNSLFS